MNHYDYFNPLESDSNSSDIQYDKEDEDEKKFDAQMKKQKGNTKNTYINKISSLIKIANSEQVEEKGGKKQVQAKSSNQLFGGASSVDKEDKLKKNRESARNSRKRKKIYLELLENKVTILSEQLESFQKVNDSTADLAMKLQHKISQKQEQDQNKMILFSNLQNTVQNNVSEMNIDTIIESLNKKFGAGSFERQQQLDHYFNQIYENCLSPYLNYIIGAAKTEQDIFNGQSGNGDSGVLRNLKLTEKQKQILLKKHKKLLRFQNDLTNTLSSFQEIKNQIQIELGSYGQTLEQLRKELKPNQVGKFLIEIEKKDMQHHFREQFEKYFGAEMDEDDSLDLYQFMAEHNYCNTLGIDIQQTYHIYKQSKQFLSRKYDIDEQKQQLNKDE
ncbi:unnamed protein product [Paramecium octaurelia]|uniref:BZIP domain-containing protein n=1 Tax=Paramecium octaurelia TaxID=43137 RepID=A0A8S1SW84_PAROT|nr:unnamed protein product [Paramecium octaurelia]